MERNHNPQVVTIATELYHELLAMAKTSPSYTTRRIQRHARKFNPHLQPEHHTQVRDFERERTKLIRDTRDIVAKYAGKVMYAKTNIYANSDRFDPVYTAVIIRRPRPKQRYLVEVYKADELGDKHKSYQAINPGALIATLPDDYIDGVGNYTGTLVKANGNCDHREDIARRQREYEERRTQQKETTEEPKYDVLVAREV